MARPDRQPDGGSASGVGPTTGACLLALMLMVVVPPLGAEPGPPAPGGTPIWPGDRAGSENASDGRPPQGMSAPDPSTRWLDEVRAQRKAWEERRRASREAFEARRRLADPWGAAQHEVWEDEVERRREARRLQREQEHLRDLGPSDPPLPWPEAVYPHGFPGRIPPPTAGSPPSASATAEGRGAAPGEPLPPGIIYPPDTPLRGSYSPQDWDNLWYYRGY